MTPDQLAELKDNATLRKRLAKAIAKHCFRNTKLEDLHAADRIDDEEMRALMIDVVDHCYDYLMELCSPHGAEIMEDLKRRDEVPVAQPPGSQLFLLSAARPSSHAHTTLLFSYTLIKSTTPPRVESGVGITKSYPLSEVVPLSSSSSAPTAIR